MTSNSLATHGDETQIHVPEPFMSPSLFQALFWKPRFATDDAITAHLPLLFWLSTVQRPQRTAVLGCNTGVAHFAFCQTVDQLGLEGVCRGFGFWIDPKKETLTATVPLAIKRHQDMLYEGISDITPCTDVETALNALEADAVDLLLCDMGALPVGAGIKGELLISFLATSGILVLHGTTDIDAERDDLKALVSFARSQKHVEFLAEGGTIILAKDDTLLPPLQFLFQSAKKGRLPKDIEMVFMRSGAGMRAAASVTTLASSCKRAERALSDVQKELEALDRSHEDRSLKLAEAQNEIFELQDRPAAIRRNAAIKALFKAREALGEERAIRFEETGKLTQMAEELRAELAAVTHEREASVKANKNLRKEKQDLLKSTSWRITAPIRAIKSKF